MKITKKDLSKIFDMALNNYTNDSSEGLTEQQFRTKCYIEAFVGYLNVERPEYEERIPYDPPEE